MMDPGANEKTKLLKDVAMSNLQIQDPNSQQNTNANAPHSKARSNSTGQPVTLLIDEDPVTAFASLPFYKRYFSCFFPSLRPDMPPEKKLTASWLEKWTKYGRFPYKFCLHLLVVIFSTTLVFELQQDNAYMVANLNAFYFAFFPDGYSPTYGFDPNYNQLNLYTIEDVIVAVNGSVEAFYQFPDESVDLYRFGNSNDSAPVPPRLVVTSYKEGGAVFNPNNFIVNAATITREYNLTLDDLGPLSGSEEEIQNFFMALDRMEIHFILYNTQLLNDHVLDHQWSIVLLFDNSNHGGQIVLSLSAERQLVHRDISWDQLFGSTTVILNIVTLLLCAASVLMSVKAIAESFYLYQQTKKIVSFKKMNTKKKANLGAEISWANAPDDKITRWSELPFSIKLRFFNFWFINNIIGNICIIIACCFEVLSSLGPESTIMLIVKLLLGLGCMLSWINMMRYLEFDQKNTLLIRALGNGMPFVIRFIVGAFPVFLGYALFGMLLFSQYTARFSNLDEAAITLFSLQNGDDLQNTFRSTDGASKWISRLYFYSFVFIFIYAVANIFIAIIEDAYFKSKDGRASGMLSDDKRGNNSSVINQDSELNNDEKLWNEIFEISSGGKNKGAKDKKPDKDTKKDKEKDKQNELALELTKLIKEEQEQFQKSLEAKIAAILSSKGHKI